LLPTTAPTALDLHTEPSLQPSCPAQLHMPWRRHLGRISARHRQLRHTTAAPATKERWQMKLTLIKFLTPAHFATVKRQCMALNTQLSAEEWLDQLQIE
jgi:hypothetical protein